MNRKRLEIRKTSANYRCQISGGDKKVDLNGLLCAIQREVKQKMFIRSFKFTFFQMNDFS